jgi:L-seryl-tRNA(Ser) seleniumtransferase
MSTAADTKSDRFGNPIDAEVGYARGQILRSSLEESRRLARARDLIRERLTEHGEGSVYIFTGNQREFPVPSDELATLCEEWTGPSLFWSRLEAAVIGHFGGDGSESVSVFNRTSAGIVATISALATGGTVVALAAKIGGSHVSVSRGARVAGARVVETADLTTLPDMLVRREASLLVVTPFASDLAALASDTVSQSVQLSRGMGIPVLVDDAYGARLRPAIQGGPLGLRLGADLVISNSDKAGLSGPRAGFMAGRSDLIGRVTARAAELGQEARAPLAVGVLHALDNFTPATVAEEIEAGSALYRALALRLGEPWVRQTPLGPLIAEEDVLSLALERADLGSSGGRTTPSEASATLGMVLLRDSGILTVNAAGAPGARVSLRLKPVPGSLERCGGIEYVVQAVDDALDRVAELVRDEPALRLLLLGDG